MNNTVKLDVQVYPIEEPKGKTVAFANVGIDDMLAISGIRVVNGEKGNFVAMPQTQDKKGEYHNVATPVNDDLRKEINKAVLAEYKAVCNEESIGRFAAEIKGERENSIGVKVYPLKDPQSSTMAFANITVDNLVAINGARVVSGEKGDFVAMPQSRDKEGNYHDIAFPINGELRKELNKAVLAEYDKAQNRSADRGNSFSDRLAEGAQKSAQYTKPAGAVAKGAPGLGD
jgi:stage V sporulation protein G